MNNCNFTGRLTKDPELKRTSSGTALLDFTLAVDRRDKEKNTDFIPCKAWSTTAETMSNFLRKGSLIAINGRLESRTYEKEGQKRYIYEIVVNSFEFLEKRAADPAPATAPTPPPVVEEELLPFSIE